MGIKYIIWIEENGKMIFSKGQENILKIFNKHHSLYVSAKNWICFIRQHWEDSKHPQNVWE